MIAIVLALQLLAAMPAAPAAAPLAVLDSTPPAPGLPNFVQVGAVAGLPADSVVRAQFLAGFRGEFAEDELPAERPARDGAWASSAPLSNRFKWLEGDPSEDAWKLRVELGVPAAVVLPKRKSDQGRRALESRRRSRGMIAVFAVQAPSVDGHEQPVIEERVAFTFAPTGVDSTGVLAMPAAGYIYPWKAAGQTVARLALEVLHRRHGDMDHDERLSIAPASRSEAGR